MSSTVLSPGTFFKNIRAVGMKSANSAKKPYLHNFGGFGGSSNAVK